MTASSPLQRAGALVELQTYLGAQLVPPVAPEQTVVPAALFARAVSVQVWERPEQGARVRRCFPTERLVQALLGRLLLGPLAATGAVIVGYPPQRVLAGGLGVSQTGCATARAAEGGAGVSMEAAGGAPTTRAPATLARVAEAQAT